MQRDARKIDSTLVLNNVSNPADTTTNPEDATAQDDENSETDDYEHNPIRDYIFRSFVISIGPSPDEYQKLLNLLVLNDQLQTFDKEYLDLKKSGNVDSKSVLFQLNPFLCPDDSVIKMNSRLSNAEILPEQVKYPKILSKGSRLSELIIMNIHIDNAHAYPQYTHRMVRNKYWILGGKRYVTSVIRTCKYRKCVMNRATPIVQDAPPLPKQRFETEVFSCISADGLGPFKIKVESVCNFKSNCIKCHKDKSEADMKEENVKPRKFG